jgi:hypothetical protein
MKCIVFFILFLFLLGLGSYRCIYAMDVPVENVNNTKKGNCVSCVLRKMLSCLKKGNSICDFCCKKFKFEDDLSKVLACMPCMVLSIFSCAILPGGILGLLIVLLVYVDKVSKQDSKACLELVKYIQKHGIGLTKEIQYILKKNSSDFCGDVLKVFQNMLG